MTVPSLERYLRQLLKGNRKFDARVVETIKKKAKDAPGITESERKFLAENFLERHRHLFDSEETARDLSRFLMLELESPTSPLERLSEAWQSIPGNLDLLVEAIGGQIRQIFRDGSASPEKIHRVRQEARKLNFRGKVSLAKVDPKAKLGEVETALKKTIESIDGFSFLARPPRGKEKNEHTVLIKVGMNWGKYLYPTVTSCESVYAVTKMCLEEAEKRGAAVKVLVGDESGFENRAWFKTTMGNFEHTGILHAAVFAGLEWAAMHAKADPEKFDGALGLLSLVSEGYKVNLNGSDTHSREMILMAGRAGVEIKAFGYKDDDFGFIPVPGRDMVRHFKDGIPVPKIVAEEVTDIINLPKPPGRHLILGNSGLTGALKNYIGLFQATKRCPAIHGEHDRFPDRAGRDAGSYEEMLHAVAKDRSRKRGLAREFARSVNFREDGPDMSFHEKIAEIYLAFAEKERFSVADMRRTVSSLGPDFGDTLDIGAVIAAKDPVTLDLIAAAFLKKAYVEIGSWFDALKPGGDTFKEYLAGKTWLKSGDPFDLLSHIAANSYGIGPVDLEHIEFLYEGLGFAPEEIDGLKSYLRRWKARSPARNKLYASLARGAGLAAVSLALTAGAAWGLASLKRHAGAG